MAVEKMACEKALASGDSSDIRSLVFHISGKPSIAVSGCFSPTPTWEGTEILSLHDPSEHGDRCTLNLITKDADTSILILTWLQTASPRTEIFAKSMLDFQDNYLAARLITMCLDHVENIHFRPSWWHSLSETSQQYVRQHAGVDLNGRVSAPLMNTDPFQGDFHVTAIGKINW